MHTISIALATYNGGKYLEEQLNSLQLQTLFPIELVVCDDASTDNTIEIINKFATRASFPVKIVVNNNRLGYRENFMKAANLCKGDLIAFCDQDDVWHGQKLLEVERRFQDARILLVSHNANVVNSERQIIGKVNDSEETEDVTYGPLGVSPWQFPLGFTMTFRRELLVFSELRDLSVDYFDGYERLAHDQWIFLLAVAFGQIVRAPDILADYRQHGSNAFGLEREKKSLVFRIKEKFTKYVNFDSYEKACRQIVVMMEQSDLLPLDDELRLRKEQSTEFFENLASMYKKRYFVYSKRGLLSRVRSWLALRAIGGYDNSLNCHFEKKEAVRDFFLGVIMAGLHRKRHQGPALDWSLIVNAKL